MGDARIGTTVADYRIESFLGRGGQGMVYLAEHVHLGRKAALKLLPTDIAVDQEFRERFIREARLAASIDHPNILPVYDAGEENGELFLAQKLVRGMDLGAYLDREGHLSPERTVELLEPVAGALDAAHRRGLVHRDVKPSNILIQLPTDDEPERVYLSDFGLTKDLVSEQDMAGSGRLTKAGYFVGTPYYSAPEQIEAGALDGRTDEYSLACVLYQCLTGEVPFPRPSETAALVAHVVDPPPAPSQHVAGLPRALDTVVATGMAKRQGDRFPTCLDLVRAARLALSTADAGPTPPARPDAPPPPRAPEPVTPPPLPPPVSPPPFDPRIAQPPPPRKGGSKVPAIVGGGLAAVAMVVVLFLVVGKGGGNEPGPTGPSVPTGTTDGNGTTAPIATVGVNQFVVTRVINQTDNDLFVESTGGETTRNLTQNPAQDFAPSLSRDRSQIVFTSQRDGGDNDIFLINADGTGLRQLTQNGDDDSFPSFSPDGSEIVFTSSRSGDFDIFVMDTSGGNVRQLTTEPSADVGPAWSPDGTTIAFATNRISGGNDTDIFLMGADGSNPTLFAAGQAIEESPAWSPDGTRISFDSNQNGAFDIFIQEVGSSVPTQGPSTAADDVFSSWSPDGSELAFSSIEPNGRSRIVVAPVAGGSGQTTQVAEDERDPAWG